MCDCKFEFVPTLFKCLCISQHDCTMHSAYSVIRMANVMFNDAFGAVVTTMVTTLYAWLYVSHDVSTCISVTIEESILTIFKMSSVLNLKCVICRDILWREKISTISTCGHLFHDNCIRQALHR